LSFPDHVLAGYDVDVNSEPEPTEFNLSLRNLGAAAARLRGEWQLDAEAVEVVPEPEPPAEPPPPVPAGPRLRLFESTDSDETPPPPERIIEAMLFVGGPPLTAANACAAIRSFTPGQFQIAIDTLNRKYRSQRRPYLIQPRDGGYAITILPAFRSMREKLYGGPKETRLSQPALDVLAVIAYQQPIGKSEIDSAFGADSSGIVRSLVRLGLVAMLQRAEAGHEVRYGTTPRLLTLFGLRSLDDLPRLGETEAM
jgi:segregation and condensation protein B